MGNDGGGMFSLVWGLGATGMGLVLASDFRGAAGWLALIQETSAPISGRRFGAGRIRLVGAVFAVAGLPVLVSGVIDAARHGLGGDASLRVPLPFLAGMCVIAVYGMWALWRPEAPLRRMWATGSGLRRTALAVQTATVPAFLVCLRYGTLTAVLACWLVGVGALLTALAAGPSRRAPAAP
ncbi:hypothetical protein ACFXDJ_21365 [Streptomyces sp. NPDC059443]|uniref:hypothetical protein n=1 Tax=unclassified Streptomyces TaxID=2593676 RepID=UPI0036A86964